MKTQPIAYDQIDRAIRHAEVMRSAYVAGACKAMMHRLRSGRTDKEIRQQGLSA